MTSSNRTLTTLGSIREFFVLREAEATVTAYQPDQRERVHGYVAAGARRLASGRRTLDDVAAAVLLRDAVRLYRLASEAARGAAPAPEADPGDDDRLRAALDTGDPLYFDRLSRED
ncbi:MAG: hypothetical protein ACRENE_13435, partial [Polyangiaceae bacterium]